MNQENDARFHQLLHAYELGLLTDEERREFELLLMASEEYFERALDFEKTAELLKKDPDIRLAIKNRAEELETEITGEKTKITPVFKKRWFTLVPVSVAAIIIFFILILKDWQLEFHPSDQALATENLLAVMYFDNLTDPEDIDKTGEIITNLLITDLSESQYLQVVSSQHLYDLLKLLGHEGVKKLDRETVSRVAEKAKARWIIQGSIISEGAEQVITYQLIETASGQVISSGKITGEADESIFTMTDKLTLAIKEDLPITVDFTTDQDRMIAEVTTSSREAYRYYIIGTDNYYKLYNREALTYFKKAVTYDSTFAMAYYYLTILEDRRLLDKVVKYSNNVSLRERYYIDALVAGAENDLEKYEAILKELVRKFPYEKEGYNHLSNFYYRSGAPEKALENLKAAIEIDPLYKLPYNLMAYIYNNRNDFDSALWAINKYIELAPDEANPYDTRGEIYAKNGYLKESIASYRQAVDIKSDFYSSLSQLGLMYIFDLQYEKADSSFQLLSRAKNKTIRSAARLYRAYIPTYQGKFHQALSYIDTLFNPDSLKVIESKVPFLYLRRLKVSILDALNQHEAALDEMERTLTLCDSIGSGDNYGLYYLYVDLLVRAGENSQARMATDSLKQLFEENTISGDAYWFNEGILSFAVGNYEQARVYFEKAFEINPTFQTSIMRARTYLELGELPEAIAFYERLLKRYSSPRMNTAIWSIESMYYLALAYDKSGRYDNAARQYQLYLSILKDADPDILHIPQARENLNRLRNRP